MKKSCLLFILILLLTIITHAGTIGENKYAYKFQFNKNKPNISLKFENIPQVDKLKHFTLSLYITTSSYYVANHMMDRKQQFSKRSGAIISLSAGLGKETYDLLKKEQGIISFLDILADVAGIITGLIIINGIENG